MLLAACPIEDLRIAGNRLGGKGVRCIAEAVKPGSTLTALDVSKNHADAVAGAALGRMLVGNDTLRRLDCAWNEARFSVYTMLSMFHLGPST